MRRTTRPRKRITLSVNNLDDTAPTITSGGTGRWRHGCRERVGYGRVYGRCERFRDVTGGVTYSLDSAGDASNFSIDANTGEVTLVTAFDYEAPKTSYSFTVIATDAASNTSSKTVTGTVTNADEDAPTFAPADGVCLRRPLRLPGRWSTRPPRRRTPAR